MRLVLSIPRPLCGWSVMLSTHRVSFVRQCWTADLASWHDRFYRLCLTSLETVYEVPYALTRCLAAPQLMPDLVLPVLSPPLCLIPGRRTQRLLFRTLVPAALGQCWRYGHSSSIGRWKALSDVGPDGTSSVIGGICLEGSEEPWPFLALILLHGYKFTDFVPITNPTIMYLPPCHGHKQQLSWTGISKTTSQNKPL